MDFCKKCEEKLKEGENDAIYYCIKCQDEEEKLDFNE